VVGAGQVPRSVISPGIEVVEATTRGAALNTALTAAANPTIMVVDDDCLVSTQWVGVGWRHAIRSPNSLGWGHLLPLGDSRRVPSNLHAPRTPPVASCLTWGHTRAGIMVLPRTGVLEVGGFVENDPMDVDLELSHRWQSLGYRTGLVPDLVSWRQPWRGERQLTRLSVEQARARGAFYGRLLRNGDRAALPAIADEWGAGLRSVVASVRHHRPRWSDPRRGILRGLPGGIVRGLASGRSHHTQ
jgi:hypothetical protein